MTKKKHIMVCTTNLSTPYYFNMKCIEYLIIGIQSVTEITDKCNY